ncbi:MAG: histidinol dehydrogenase [Verrucomicrobiales bacterium]|nr:histidinol dehydrogenase [Verrucomicrobiales bacterium]
MNLLRQSDADFDSRLRAIAASSSLFDEGIEQRTRDVIRAVASRGDDALTEFTERFDGVRLVPSQFAVSTAELMSASLKATEQMRAAVRDADRNIAAFARKSLRKAWSARNAHGGRVGEKFDPLTRVGIYIPGGTAPLASTALMTITLARVAGCPQIVVCTPPGRDGMINPALLFAARTAGATEIYKVGGAQAVAAMSLGTTTIARVSKVFGPGNAYVVAAKRLLFGQVAVDLLPGPSEVLVLADDSANPAFIAADLLAQAEHGSGHERVWLVTPSARVITGVQREIARQLTKCDRREFIEKILATHGWVIQVKNLAAGVAVANQLAPEHCEIHTRNAAALSKGVITAGAIFLGPWSPTVLGDYVAGPSHTLPTGGAGRAFAGLTVDQFQRRTSVVEYSKAALKKAVRSVETFAGLEGLDAHGRSATVRTSRS